MAAARPQVTVYGDEKTTQVRMPEVFLAPIRPDIVHFVHTNMAKNARQAYAVSRGAGHQHSAESWGTGRAVSRIPRVSGGGTSRAGQAAFGNMCRKGRMFAPTRIWRKWHRKINVNQKRYAVASAIAASAIPSLVLARGHRIAEVPEVPLVVSNKIESVNKTKEAVAFLKSVGAYADVEKAKASRKIRAGQGKLRNRRFVQRRGPLVVYNKDEGIVKGFRNLPGVEVVPASSLNLLQLAPGGHVGRFVVWTKDAFSSLSAIWGSTKRVAQFKKGYKLPYCPMTNTDITRIINSSEIQSNPKIKAAKRSRQVKVLKRNPLKNKDVMAALNPYSVEVRKAEQAKQAAGARAAALKAKRAAQKANNIQKKVNYAKIQTDYQVLTKPDLSQYQADAQAARKAAKEAAAAAKLAEEEAEEALKAKKLAAQSEE